MDNLSESILVVFVVLCAIVLFVGFMSITIFWSRRIGVWHLNKVKALNKDDLAIYGMRNILYSAIIGVLFFLPVILYMIFRPSFFDPTWSCFFLGGGALTIIIFQAFQYIWLYSRTNKK